MNSNASHRCGAAALALVTMLLAAAKVPAVTIDWTTVGNPNNHGGDMGRPGAVDHVYRIGTYEVTTSQYVEFLNAKDPTGANTLFLYYSGMEINFSAGRPTGGKYTPNSGAANHPVNYVSLDDAARFANWLNNGQGNGDTETGAYTLGVLGYTRNPGAAVFLPSVDEWYKAAYYDPTRETYFLYPTASNLAPTNEAPPGGSNSANYSNVVGHLTDVGAYTLSASPYGTFDQAGNVEEWTDTLWGVDYEGPNHHPRAFYYFQGSLRADQTFFFTYPSTDSIFSGFRVASIPEPSSIVIAVIGVIGLVAWAWRRR